MNQSNLKILAYEQTPLGPLCLRRRELLSSPGTVVTEITLDHQFLMSSLYTASEQALARIALEMHPGTELDVLVGGLGLGYTAHAALQSSRVGRVLALELLPEVVEWMNTDLLPLSPVLSLRRVRRHLAPGGVLGVWSWAESSPFGTDRPPARRVS